MIERRLIQQLNSKIKLCNENDEILFHHNYNGKLKVAVEKIFFSPDCFHTLLDISSSDLVTQKAINYCVEWENFMIEGYKIFNLPSVLTNIFFSEQEFVKKFGKDRSVYVYQANHLDFKECNYVNEINCTIYLRDIANNIIFKPNLFEIELIFTDDIRTFSDKVI